MPYKLIKSSLIIGILLPITSFIISFVIGVYIFNKFPGNDYYGAVHFYFMTSILTILIAQYVIAKIIQNFNTSQFLTFVLSLIIIYFFTSFYTVKMYLEYFMDLLPARSHFELLVAYSIPFTNHIFQTVILLVNTVVTYLNINRKTKTTHI